MVKTKLIGAAGRYGARYGKRVKKKIADIESRQRKKQRCPFCGGIVKRLSKGIWKCKKCKKKFAAHAYYIEEGSMEVKAEKPEKTKSLKKPTSKKTVKATKKVSAKTTKKTKSTKTKE